MVGISGDRKMSLIWVLIKFEPQIGSHRSLGSSKLELRSNEIGHRDRMEGGLFGKSAYKMTRYGDQGYKV